ncbi:dTDP-4-dehydrorhamnose reductase [Rhizobium helianthi]|uniref:dTDP-4-dehydrorhamnose reductase n=1 Tax=Rhizobium helianthi TaxID=1132695 RepID=A0ABW4M7F7_9HYPH
MKALLFGKNGQVGAAINRAFPPSWDLISLDRREAPLDDLRGLREILASEKPDIIINAAAYTAVDKAEAEPELAGIINRDAPALMADFAQQTGAWLVHYSTDYVYDGRNPYAYVESDAPNPLSVYGRTKLEGDLAIAASDCRHLIFRVSWVYASGHRNFPQTILNLALERATLNVVGDQIGAPTDAKFIADVTVKAAQRIVDDPEADRLSGLYHLSPSGEIDRAGLARFIVGEAAAAGAKLALSADDIKAISTADYPQPAARPLNSRLDVSRLTNAFLVNAPDWREAMRAWIASAIGGSKRDT